MEKLQHDIVIVGGGAAGLRAAIAAAEFNDRLSIALVSKVYPMRSHTVSAEGGTAAVMRDYDNYGLHALDTIKGSDYLADQETVEVFVKECPQEIIQLEHWGCPWSRDPDGRIALRAFGGMSVKRTCFAADKTGFHLLHTLFQRSMMHASIVRYDEWFVTSLVVEEGRVKGLTAIDMRTGELAFILATAVIIATGGAGRLYRFTTNAQIKTGDGMAIANRAGAHLKDMEFIQFHPTALPGTGILITEAARGEGGFLINNQQERFLNRYVPEKMELGPRDILSRAIITEIQEGKGFEGPYGSYILLDLRHLGEDAIDHKLPFVRELARSYIGIDPVYEPIPVRPGVHYTMGGIHTEINGRTPISGLYACGEAACVSINGANRLGSNSLSECLVFGKRSGLDAAQYSLEHQRSSPPTTPVVKYWQTEEAKVYDYLRRERSDERVSNLRLELQDIMEKYVGIFRNESGLSEACRRIRRLKERLSKTAVDDKSLVYNTDLTAALELEFMLDVAETVAHSALTRRESRGAHSRTDFANRDDTKFLHHQLSKYSPEGPKIEKLNVSITRWEPVERKY